MQDNIFDQDHVLIPINVKLAPKVFHWVLIVVDVQQKEVLYYDSLPNIGLELLKVSLFHTLLQLILFDLKYFSLLHLLFFI